MCRQPQQIFTGLLGLLLAAASSSAAIQEVVLPGQAPNEIVLSAHCGPVAESRHSGDGASGCDAAIAAAAELRRTPLRHTVRVLLYREGASGSAAWLAGLAPGARDRILADLNLEITGWPEGGGGVVILSGGRRLAPGWLVHAVLKSGEAVDWPFAVADERFPLLAQLVVRSAWIVSGSGSESFLRWDVPSVTLADSSLFNPDPGRRSNDDAARLDARRRERWIQTVAAAVRRLDALAGRPLPEDQYLVLCGRVWLRRDLMWMGFLLWMLLVFRGRPGRWRGSSAAEHGRQMRAYLPGFLFRLLLLLSIFLAPVFSVLLLPAAALALVPPRPVWARAIWMGAGGLPFLTFLSALGFAVAAGIARLDFQAGAAAAFLIPVTLAAYAWMIARDPSRAPLTLDHAAGKVES